MAIPERKFKPEDIDRNMKAALALLAQRRTIAMEAHRKLHSAHLAFVQYLMLQGGAGDGKVYRKLNAASERWRRAVAAVDEIEHAIRRVNWAEHECAIAVELARPKTYVKLEFDPNYQIPGPNEVLEARKWWR